MAGFRHPRLHGRRDALGRSRRHAAGMTNEPSAHPSSATPAGTDLFRRLAIAFAPMSGPLAGRRWFRLWGVLHHVGRTTGRAYAIPVVTRRYQGGFVIPLPFGERTQWIRNLQAVGGGRIRWDGRDYFVAEPTIVDLDEVAAAFRGYERSIMRRIGARFVRVVDAPTDGRQVSIPG
jgi:deazaflavin-dependent oxidoreductase (nitroreductase family)